MSLTSPLFLLGFLPAVVLGVHLLRRFGGVTAAQVWLVGCSLAFYAMDGLAALPLLLGSVVANWAFARAIGRAPVRSAARVNWLRAGLVANLALLCVFKYADLVAMALRDSAGLPVSPPHWRFPLGISFFTLSQIMYLVDCYERIVLPTGLLNGLTLYTFFPNITAGPLVRAKRMLAQVPDIASPTGIDQRLTLGLGLLAIGLFKKSVLGDSFSFVANAGYAGVGALSMLEAWVTTVSYAFQMYFDFSGYSDMAVGAAFLIGIELPRNFNAPFRAVNISDFWQRWHISLSTFITTYLYSPLVRRQRKPTVGGSAVATLFAMTLAGLWHGASWTFFMFYVMHGVALALYQFWKRRKTRVPKLLSIALTFAFVNLCFVVFRSPDLSTALMMSTHLLPFHDVLGTDTLLSRIATADWQMILIPLLVGAVAAFVGPTSDELARRAVPSVPHLTAITATLLVSAAFLVCSAGTPFIYRAF